MKKKELTNQQLNSIHIMRNNGVSYRQIEERMKEIYKLSNIPTYSRIRRKYINWLAKGGPFSEEKMVTSDLPTSGMTGSTLASDNNVTELYKNPELTFWQIVRKFLRR